MSNTIWREKADTIQFADISFTITRYYLEEIKPSQSLDLSKKSVSNLEQITSNIEAKNEQKGIRFNDKFWK